MKQIFSFLKDLSWIDYLLLSSISLFTVIYDFCSVRFIPIEKVHTLPILYGFPLPNKTSTPWVNSGERGIYLAPFILDFLFHLLVITIFYWFIMRYVFNINLRKRIVIPFFFGILFLNLSPFILPQQWYSLAFIDLPFAKFDVEFNWFGNWK